MTTSLRTCITSRLISVFTAFIFAIVYKEIFVIIFVHLYEVDVYFLFLSFRFIDLVKLLLPCIYIQDEVL